MTAETQVIDDQRQCVPMPVNPAPTKEPLWKPSTATGVSHYLGDHKAITRTAFGQKIFVDTRDVGITPHLLMDGMWEPAVSEVFKHIVGSGMVVVDIGANIGWYTLLAAFRVGEKGRVIAFEPNTDLVNLLYRSIEVNGFGGTVTVEETGVMDRSCTLEFYKWANHQASSNFFWNSPSRAQHDTTETMQVNCVSLDDYFREHPCSRVDVIKIDAEGSEPKIIAGAENTLRANPLVRILMEFNPAYRDTIERLMLMGFRVAAIEEDASLTFMSLTNILKRPLWSTLLFTR